MRRHPAKWPRTCRLSPLSARLGRSAAPHSCLLVHVHGNRVPPGAPKARPATASPHGRCSGMNALACISIVVTTTAIMRMTAAILAAAVRHRRVLQGFFKKQVPNLT